MNCALMLASCVCLCWLGDWAQQPHQHFAPHKLYLIKTWKAYDSRWVGRQATELVRNSAEKLAKSLWASKSAKEFTLQQFSCTRVLALR